MMEEDWSAVRSIPPKEKGNRGAFFTEKVGSRVVEYESQIERDFYLLLDHDPTVSKLQHQPKPKIPWKYGLGKKGKDYPPDSLVELYDGRRFRVEIKDEDTYNKKRDYFEEKYREAEEWCRQRGTPFKLLLDVDIRTPRLANIWFTLGASKCHIPSYQTNQLMKLLLPKRTGKEYNTLCMELAEALGVELPKASQIVCHAIYWGVVFIPTFSTKPLTGTTRIYRSMKSTSPFSPVWQDWGWDEENEDSMNKVAQENENEDEEEKQLFHKFAALGIPRKHHELVALRKKAVKTWLKRPASKRTEEWRREFCAKWEPKFEERNFKFSERSMFRWAKKFQKTGVLGLVPGYRQRGRNTEFSQETFEQMEAIRKKFASTRMTIEAAYRKLKKACEVQGIDRIPSEAALKKYIYTNTAAAEFAKGRWGKRYHDAHFHPSMGAFKGAIMPMQVLQLDNTPLDCFPVDSEELEPLPAPWLVAAIDVNTGMITGAYLSLAHPSRLNILEVLAQSILPKKNYEDKYEALNDWPIQGHPVLILVDNGLDYRAEDVRRFCQDHEIIIEYAPIRKPQYKAYIEQWFNVLRQGLEGDEIPGLRPLLKYRKADPDFRPEQDALLTMQQLEKWVFQWILDTYHKRPRYDGHVPSPYISWTEALEGQTRLILPSPREAPVDPISIDEMLIDTLFRETKRLSKKGIVRKYIQYNSDELMELHRVIGKRSDPVTIYLDPRDIRCIWVRNPIDDRIITVEHTKTWARQLIKFYGELSISDSAWDKHREELRERYGRKVTPQILETAWAYRQRIRQEAEDAKRGRKKQTKHDRKAQELAREHEEKRTRKRLQTIPQEDIPAIPTESDSNVEEKPQEIILPIKGTFETMKRRR